MKDYPILFSGPMVVAIRLRKKTQTRRVMRPQPPEGCSAITVGIYNPRLVDRKGEEYPGDPVYGAYSIDGEFGCKSPYGQPGDRLVLLSSWATEKQFDDLRPKDLPNGARIWTLYEGGKPEWCGKTRSGRFVPKMLYGFFPRALNKNVHCERLWDISEADAVAEGCSAHGSEVSSAFTAAVDEYYDLWNLINAKRGYPFESNQFVWAIDFEVME